VQDRLRSHGKERGVSEIEKRTDRWITIVCKQCNGRRFDILKHVEGEALTTGDLQCKTCGRIARITMAEIAPGMAQIG
jgi:hypothetical protein